LPRALAATLKHNPAVKGQNVELLIQHDVIDAAKAGRYPSIYGSLSSNEDIASYMEVDQPLLAFGKISSAIAAEETGLALQQQVLQQVKRELMEQTANAYTQVLSARLKIRVAEDNYQEHKKLFDRISRRQQRQLASKADVNLAESRLLTASSDLLSYKSEQQAALNELYTLTRVRVDTQAEIDPALLQLPDVSTLKKQVLQSSADVTRAIEQVNLTKAQLKQSESAIYPTISINVRQYMLDYYDNETRVGVMVKGSLDGMGFGSYNRVQGAEKSITAARYELDSVCNEIERETENLLVNRFLQKGLRDSKIRIG
jgi:adhesin transport system outer membrane protein